MDEGSDDPVERLARAKAEGDRGRTGKDEEVAERPGSQVLQDETWQNLTDDNINVHIVVPARDMVHGWFAYSIALAMGYMGKHHPYVDLHLLWNNGTILSEQRSELAKLALLGGADWVVWFDSDMRFPIDTIERLLAHNKPIVMAGYPTRKPPAIEPTQYADDETTVRVYTEKDSTGLQEIASGGFGCIAVHKSVFEAMPPPWFHIPWNEKELKFECGEDIYFCRKAREAGFKIYLDHDLSKKVSHIGQYEFGHIEALACRQSIEKLRPQRIKVA